MEYSSVRRIASVFNFFVEHPRQSFTVAQVTRSLKLSRSTCVNIMNGLVEVGYLYRNEDRTYVLGPAILTMARQARIALTPFDIARLEIRRLADKLDAIVAVHSLEDGEVVLRERAVSSSHLMLDRAPDMRFALQSLGILFLCTLPDGDVERVLDQADPPLSDEQRGIRRRAIRFARTNGFVFGERTNPAGTNWRRMSPEWPVGEFAIELEPERSYRLQYLLAPVMDPQGAVAFEISVSGFAGEHLGEDIAEMGRKLVESCSRVTTFMTGKQVFDFGRTAEAFPVLPKLQR